MKIILFSDVHGNFNALQAVLIDAERHEPDLIIFAGDLCLMGPSPGECLRLVRGRRLPAVVGNTDGWLAGIGNPPEQAAAALAWTRAQLTADDLAWLGRLPFGLRVSPTGRAADDLLIVHANPRDVNDIIYPAEPDQQARWGDVRQPDAALRPLLAGVDAAVLAFGHLHIPSIRTVDGLTLVNVASVSMPGDGDGRAKYALLAWDGHGWSAGHGWSISHHRVGYDVAAEAAAFRERRPPGWEQAVAALEQDGYYYPQRV